jgi:zinc transporter
MLGMNVSGIPLAENNGGFWFVCVALIVLAVGLVWWMRKSRLF